MKAAALFCLAILFLSAVPEAEAVESSAKMFARHGQSAMTRERVAKTNAQQEAKRASSVVRAEGATQMRGQLRKDFDVDAVEQVKVNNTTVRHGQAAMSRNRLAE